MLCVFQRGSLMRALHTQDTPRQGARSCALWPWRTQAQLELPNNATTRELPDPCNKVSVRKFVLCERVDEFQREFRIWGAQET
jgi:hypothetical protein